MISAVPRPLLYMLPVLIVPLPFYLYLKYKEIKTTRPENIVYDIIFFTDKGAGCREHILKKTPCCNTALIQGTCAECVYSHIRKIVGYIEDTKECLDVCIFLLTCHEIANAILKVHKEGKEVRVIADADMAEQCGSQIGFLNRNGVSVRMKNSSQMMHHKFFVRDKSLLLTGSFNWTMQAVTGNWDNAIITSQPTLVKKLSGHFEYLWQEFA